MERSSESWSCAGWSGGHEDAAGAVGHRPLVEQGGRYISAVVMSLGSLDMGERCLMAGLAAARLG
jgi:hypothetical protein